MNLILTDEERLFLRLLLKLGPGSLGLDKKQQALARSILRKIK